MPPTPSQIREQLLKAIDQDAKVINMVGVLEAISCLENTQITKEALEETRLGKIVNDIRKNTADSSLSTRCKKLVRIWNKQFVRGAAAATPSSTTKQPSGSTQDEATNRQSTPPAHGIASNTPAGGKRTPTLKAKTCTTPSSTSIVDKKKSENHKRRKLGSSPGKVSSTGSAPSTKKPRPAVNTPTSNATKDSTSLEKKNGMPAQKNASNNSKQRSSKSVLSKVKPSESKSSSRTSSPALKAKGTSSPGVSKLNANKALSKSPLSKPVLSAVNSSGSKLSPLVVTASNTGRSSPSVKANQSSDFNCTDSSHLDADTCISGKSNDGTKDILTSSRLHTKSLNVQKSLSDSNSSSATVKLRSPSPCVTEQSTSLTSACSPAVKHDGVSESIETDTSTHGPSKTSFSIFDDDYEEEDDIHSDEKYRQTLAECDKEPVLSSLALSTDGVEASGGSIFSIASVEMTDENDGVAAKEAGNISQEQERDIQRECEEDQVPSKPATEEDVQRIHEQQWDGVNGCYNNQREWFDWTQSLSVTVQEDEALHILPYICID